MHRIISAIDRAPRAVLAGLLAIHVALWGLIPALTQPNLPLDMIEGLAWGHEWQWAYYKHPPLPPWITEAAAQLTQGWDRPLFFLGPLAAAAALLLIWRLAKDIVGPRAALIAVLLQEGVLYFTFLIPEFNHTNGQLPAWALIGWLGRRAILSGRTMDWLGLGIAGALGMLTKYSTALMLLTLGLFLLCEPTARRRLKTVGPWLALATLVVLLIPHLAKVAAIHFQPFHYPIARTVASFAWYDHILYPLHFALAQLGDVLGTLLLAALLYRSRPMTAPVSAAPAPAPTSFDRRYVAALCWGPFLFALAINAASGLRFKDMWGTPMWNYLGLFLVMFAIPNAPQIGRAFVALWLLIFGGGLVGYAGQFTGQAILGSPPLRAQFAGRLLAAEIDRGWRGAVGPAPLRYVVGDTWLAGNVAFALWRERPSVMIDGDAERSPWIDRHRLACAGGVLLWYAERTNIGRTLLAQFPGAVVQPTIVLPWATRAPHPLEIDWAILRPRSDCG